jgi:hypothetical protein
MIYLKANFTHYADTATIPPQPICGLSVGRELLREVGDPGRVHTACAIAAATPRPKAKRGQPSKTRTGPSPR